MNTKIINAFCFLLPFVSTVFNLQGFVGLYFSDTFAQTLAFGLLSLLIIGIVINLKKSGEFSKTAGLWFVFYICYYAFASVATGINGTSGNILASFIPVIYMFGFYVYLSVPQNRKLFEKVALVSFVGVSVLGIYLFKINFSVDVEGIHEWELSRSGGVVGDANSTALISIIAFISVYKKYKPTKTIFKYFRLFLLALIFYSLAITFSTTGFFVFAITLILLNHKFFNPKRILFAIILIPMFYFTLINLNTIVADYDLTTPQRDKVGNLVNLLTFNTDELDSSGRDDLLDNVLNYVYKNPIVGNGIDFSVSIRGHNTLVGVWADAGIFTFLIFLFMLGNYFKNAIKSTPDIRYFVLSTLFVLCIFMLSLQSIINQGYLMALFVYLGYIVDEDNSSNLIELNTIEHV